MTYDFECKNCKKIFDYLMKLDEYDQYKDLMYCPKCEAKMERVISAIPFRLKGSNWYRDGYSSQIDYDEGESKKEWDQHKRKEDKLNKIEREAGLQ